ncbi:MAG: trypsin-like peptidase domain-containing protein [Clostridiales bacterium]|nr:trypsin-like peptidase domain-containing protein [Clostridiales bacterium]
MSENFNSEETFENRQTSDAACDPVENTYSSESDGSAPENIVTDNVTDAYNDDTDGTAETIAPETQQTSDNNAEDFASQLENYLPTPENTDKLRKTFPSWIPNAAVSLGVCAVVLLIYSLAIVPHIKPAAVISYNNSASDSKEEKLSAASTAADKALPSIVSVSAQSSYRSFFGISSQTANGTGIIISDNGYILTSCSLIGSDGEATVTVNNTDYTAKAVGQDTSKDIAILHIDAQGLVPAALGNSDSLHIGDPVLAAGNMLGSGMGISVTRGIICGINSNLALQSGNTINLLQTDAMTDTGSAGGCLLNENGDVIGMITTAISSGSEKISFAIPSNDIKNIAESLINTGSAGSGTTSSGLMIGITGSDADHGVTVESIVEDSPAKKSGIEVGDLILKVDGTPVKSVAEINKIRDTHKAGDTIVITVYRKGETMDINVTL